MASRHIQKILTLVFLLLGGWLCVKVVRSVGWLAIVQNFHDAGWLGILVILVFPVTWLIFQSLAWQRILGHDGHHVSLLSIFIAKTIGEAINTITPVNFVGGDPYRVYLLQKKIPLSASTAAVVVDRTMVSLATAILTLGGLGVALFVLPLPLSWRILFCLFISVFLGILLVLMRAQKSGVVMRLSRILQRTRWGTQKLEKIEHRLQEIDHRLADFYRRDPSHFLEILFYHLAGRALGIVEIFLIAHLLHEPLLWQTSLLLTTLTILINMLFVFVPGSLGVLEGGYAGYFKFFGGGTPALGTSIQIMRRLRTLAWTLAGLCFMVFYHPGSSGKPQVKA